MQDNALIYTAGEIKQQFKNMSIPLLKWPPYSRDLNPIEHLWHLIKTWIQKNRPELIKIGSNKEDVKALGKTIIEAQEIIPQEQIDDLIKSMLRRCTAVVKAKGWHTKY